MSVQHMSCVWREITVKGAPQQQQSRAENAKVSVILGLKHSNPPKSHFMPVRGQLARILQDWIQEAGVQ